MELLSGLTTLRVAAVTTVARPNKPTVAARQKLLLISIFLYRPSGGRLLPA